MVGDRGRDAAEVVGHGGHSLVSAGIVDADRDGADIGMGRELLEVSAFKPRRFWSVMAVVRRACGVTFSGRGILAALTRWRSILVASWRSKQFPVASTMSGDGSRPVHTGRVAM